MIRFRGRYRGGVGPLPFGLELTPDGELFYREVVPPGHPVVGAIVHAQEGSAFRRAGHSRSRLVWRRRALPGCATSREVASV